MSATRIILAALIALALTVAPVIGQNMLPIKPTKAAMQVDDDMPCCPCCPSDQDDSKVAAACAVKCMSPAAAILAPAALLSEHLASVEFPLAVDHLQAHVSSPPTHPPPV